MTPVIQIYKRLIELLSCPVIMLKQIFKAIRDLKPTMRIRLFVFLSVLTTTMIIGVMCILMVTGVFTVGLTESKNLVKNELDHLTKNIEKQYGEISVHAINFSQMLSMNMERYMEEQGLRLSDLGKHPHHLNNIIFNEYQSALFTLQLAKCSGVFIILDSTINPKIPNADLSKSGLYIKNMEQNIISSSSPTITLFRGSPYIGRENNISLHAQWKMEFNIENAPYFKIPVEMAKKHKNSIPLSRMYYWTPLFKMPDSSDELMMCSVPLIDSNGCVFGICGLEISSMLFKLSNTPDNSNFSRITALLTPVSGNELLYNNAMVSARYTSGNLFGKNSKCLKIIKGSNTFNTYTDGKNSYLGLHKKVNLYPADSTYSNEKWAAAVLIPKEDLVRSITRLNLMLCILLFILVILGLSLSVFISIKYTRPISEGLELIKNPNLCQLPKTNVFEIDELLNFLSTKKSRDNAVKIARDKEIPLPLLEKFVENAKTLSPAEKAVFDLYVKGYTAKEISNILYLSINTIKTHSRHIYTKLNVASRKELLVYINMLKELGIISD